MARQEYHWLIRAGNKNISKSMKLNNTEDPASLVFGGKPSFLREARTSLSRDIPCCMCKNMSAEVLQTSVSTIAITILSCDTDPSK